MHEKVQLGVAMLGKVQLGVAMLGKVLLKALMRMLDITLPRGYLVRLACSGRTRLWLEYGENVSGTNVKTTHDLNQQIFEGKIISSLLESYPGGCLDHRRISCYGHYGPGHS